MGFAVRSSKSLLFWRGIALGISAAALASCSPKFNFKKSSSSTLASLGGYGPATQVVFTREPATETASSSEIPFQVTIEDAEGRVVTGGADSTAQITLSQTGGSGPLGGTLNVNAINGVAEFVYQGVNIATLGSGDVVTATKADTTSSGGVGTLTGASQSFEVITNNAWLGSSPTAEWLTTGGTPAAGQGNGMFIAPEATFVDGSGNLYVADSLNSRVDSFNSAGVYQGWVGFVNAIPTGGAAGCTTTHAGKATPGWCTGGYGGTITPLGIWGDGTYLYVTSWNGLFRFNASTGAYTGWTGLYNGNSGVMQDTYTTGCNALNGSVTHAVTPGWCVKGEGNESGSSINGAFWTATGVTGDGTYLYVGDSGGKIQRINASTGAAAGWIGNLGTVGGSGCGSSTGSFVGSWCSDATAAPQTSSLGDGSLRPISEVGLYYSGGSLFATDSINQKVNQYTASTGAFVGWIGMVNSTPTGGDAGCTSTANGHFTPGWCTEGSTWESTSINGFSYPAAVTGDGTYLYILDSNGLKITKIKITGAVYEGWIGRISNAGSGSCGSSGQFTSGWCTLSSTTAESGDQDGMLMTELQGKPFSSSWGGDWGGGGIYYASGNLWVADTGNNRVSQYSASSGDFNGWIGAEPTATAGWQTSGISAASFDDSSFGMNLQGVYTDGTDLYVGDNYRIKNYELNSGSPSYVGWTGQVMDTPAGGVSGCTSLAMGGITPGWCTGGSAQDDGSKDGNGALSLGVEQVSLTSDGTYLYAVDNSNQISRYDLNGVFQGWIGEVGSTPTGGDSGCASASVGTFTPGWCTGGSSVYGTGDGAIARGQGIYADGTYLYVTDYSDGRADKFIASTGQFVGWIGKVLTSPTGGAPGCAGAGVGSITPGWCTGGTADGSGNQNGDGSLPQPVSIIGDGTSIYTGTVSQMTINRYNASTGAFTGWIGEIGTNGGTCTAGNGNFTGGWCTGGSANFTGGTIGQGGIYQAFGLYTDGFYLYVANNGDFGLSKYVLGTGAFVGWKGMIGSVPTGGDPGCASATKGTFTPGWCTGGGTSSGYYDFAGLVGSSDISGAGSFLYVGDAGNFRIDRIGK